MRIIGLLMLMYLSFNAHAVVVSDLYQVRVPVADQSQQVRKDALLMAYQQIVIKVSGTERSLHNPVIQQEASKADRLVGSFRYVRDSGDNSLQLEIQFAQNLVETLLSKAGEPIWGKSRPLLLIWQASEQGRARSVLNQNSVGLRVQLERAMNERGIPILWPIMDIEDQSALPMGSLWGLFSADISKASARYLADAQLGARLTQLSNQHWDYQGILMVQGEAVDIQAQDANLNTLLHKVADQVATVLSQRYAVRSDSIAGGYQIQITGIKDFKRYNDAIAYLKANVAVKQARVVMMSQDALTLELELTAEWPQVWSMLSLDKRLRETDQEQVYHWQH